MISRPLPAPVLWWNTRRSRALLVAVHIPFLLVAPLVTTTGLTLEPHNPLLVTVLALAVAALQLRHSLATARGELPSYWQLTLVVLGLLVFAPLVWFGNEWGGYTLIFVASAAMLLRGRLRYALTAGPVVGVSAYVAIDDGVNHLGTIPVGMWDLVYWATLLAGGAICLYTAAHLVRTVDVLYATRLELAESTVGQERLRLSRDLHDVLGQSLSAVSLKGDLARALLRSGDLSAADEEVRSLADVARTALRDVRQVVRDEHAVSLQSETRGAADLLAAAGIAATIDVTVDNLPLPLDELLGWATREGVTNMLRHSEATTCSIRAARANGRVRLEIINDGARPTRGAGTGIAGLAERAQALSGSVTAQYAGNSRFILLLEVPEGLP